MCEQIFTPVSECAGCCASACWVLGPQQTGTLTFTAAEEEERIKEEPVNVEMRCDQRTPCLPNQRMNARVR